jgi:hypothetical protein
MKSTKNLDPDSRYSGRDMNEARTEQEPKALPLCRPTHLVFQKSVQNLKLFTFPIINVYVFICIV